MIRAIIDGLIGGLIGRLIGRKLARFRYLWSFLIGFFIFPITAFIYLVYRAGWSKAVAGVSSKFFKWEMGNLGF